MYLAFIPINDQSLSLYLINDSKKPYLAHVSEVFGDNHRTLMAGTLGVGESKKFDDRLLKEMDEWPSFYYALFLSKTSWKPRCQLLKGN
ncbi:hypothetical protein V8V91_22310 [Algoriphagus halophilus]|uniref:hypothetical protein n=1 Tax=Algoriphagus halophilus TaxID=226505 RepID=UPI00358F6771